MKIINDFSNSDGLVLTSPIRFASFVNLNFFYGPYGWKNEDGTVTKYFTKKNGPQTTRYPNESVLNIRPSGMSQSDCFITEEDQLFYKTSEVYGYALGCLYLQSVNASAGTTFGVVDNNDNVIEYIYDGEITEGVPAAHTKIDEETLTRRVINGVQDIIPTFVDKEGQTITDLGNYFESQLGDFIKQDALNSYALTTDLFDAETRKLLSNKIPTLNSEFIADIDKFAKTAELIDPQTRQLFTGKIPQLSISKIEGLDNTFAKTSDLFADAQTKMLKIDKIPDLTTSKIVDINKFAETASIAGYVSSAISKDGTIRTAAIDAVQTALQDNERMTNIVNGVVSGRYLDKESFLEDGKISATKIADLSGTYAKNENIFEEGRLKPGILPDLSNTYQTTSKMNEYVLSSRIMKDDNTLSLQALPNDISKKIVLSTIQGIDAYATKENLGAYQLSTNMGGYVRTSNVLTASGSINTANFPELGMSKINGLNSKFENYTLSSRIFDGDGIVKLDIPVSKVQGFDSKVLSVQGIALSGDIAGLAKADLSNINTTNFDTKVKAVQGLALKTDLSGYVNTSLNNIDTNAFGTKVKAVQGLVTNTNVGGYVDTAVHNNTSIVTANRLDKAIADSETICSMKADEVFSAADENIRGYGVTDKSLDALKSIFSNIKIPQIAIEAIKTNNTIYGYCTLSYNTSNNIMNDNTTWQYNDLTTKINMVDNELEGIKSGKNIYLIPRNDLKSTLVTYSLVNIKNVREFLLLRSNLYTYDKDGKDKFVSAKSSNYDPTANYYMSDANTYLGIFECYWVDRGIDYKSDNADVRVHKLPFLKTIRTIDYIDTSLTDKYTDSIFKTNFATFNSNKYVTTTSNVKLYYAYATNGDELILSGMSDTHLKMYTNSFNIELVTSFHNASGDEIPLLTLDTSGDSIGDLNEGICVIKRKSDNEPVTEFDISGNTEYYYEVQNDKNADLYGPNAKSLIEDTISWYNENLWGEGNKNYIYLFCYKDGPAKYNNVDCYGYYFRAVAYIDNSCTPLDWRPCIPYSLESKKLNYPTIVDLSGPSTTIGLPDGETVEFTNEMTTDDRVYNFLYKTEEKVLRDEYTVIIPGSPEYKNLKFIEKTINVNDLPKLLKEPIVPINQVRFKNCIEAGLMEIRSLVVLSKIKKLYDSKPGVAGLYALAMASAYLRTVKEKKILTDILSYDKLKAAYRQEQSTFDVKYFSEYKSRVKDLLERGVYLLSYDANIVKTIAFAIISAIMNVGQYGIFTRLFAFSANNKTDLHYVYVFYELFRNLKQIGTLLSMDEEIGTMFKEKIDSEGIEDLRSYLIDGYVIPSGIDLDKSILQDVAYTAAVPDTPETRTNERTITQIVPRTLGNGFTYYGSYSYVNGSKTQTGYVSEWFANNTIVRFLVKQTSRQRTYEYRKWNKFTKSWSDLGVEQYVNYDESSTDQVTFDPEPTAQDIAERLLERFRVDIENDIVEVANSVRNDFDAHGDNTTILVNRINQLTAIINSMTGATEANRLKDIVANDNDIRLSIGNYSHTASGVSCVYTDPIVTPPVDDDDVPSQPIGKKTTIQQRQRIDYTSYSMGFQNPVQ